MIKSNEREHPSSCWNKALETERVFVLLARDAAAPVAIRAWAQERIRLGKNVETDEQISEALYCAQMMESEQEVRND